jgi:transposase
MKTLQIVNPMAAGIDVGSEKLFLSMTGEKAICYGTFTQEIYRLRDDLISHKITTVALEATGVYWLYIWEVLTEAKIEVVVVNGRHVRNVPGRKTDMSDAQWLSTLHSHGLLSGGFVPTPMIRKLQDYQRLRQDHVSQAAGQVQKMQQALERMNVKLHDVITSIVGLSGLRIIEAILAGKRDPISLLALCDASIQKSKPGLVMESLQGIWREEHLFALRQAYEVWKFYHGLQHECDQQIEAVLKEMVGVPESDPDQKPSGPDSKPRLASLARGAQKNMPNIKNLHGLLVQVCGGKDAKQVPGIGENLWLQLISETGVDMSPWPTEQHFTSWAGLSPGSRQSGKRKGSQKRQRNRTGRLLSCGARSLARSKDMALGGFYRRLKNRKNGLIANIALARKMAILYYRTLKFGFEYVEKGLAAYKEQYTESQKRLLEKLAKQQGFKLVANKAA